MLAIVIVGSVLSLIAAGTLGAKLIQSAADKPRDPDTGQKTRVPRLRGVGVVMIAVIGPLLSIWAGIAALLGIIG